MEPIKERKLRKWIKEGKISSDEFNDLLQEKLVERCMFWGDVLGVCDWKFYLRITRIADMIMDGCVAEVAYNDELAKAHISICRPCDFLRTNSRDTEQELIHELLHVRLRRLVISMGFMHKPLNAIQNVLMENVIDQMSQGIIDMARTTDKGVIIPVIIIGGDD